ncbi:hypothetical protein [Pseudonocardia sp.]|uniref:hypothetical protein n=1 Tax=Pseudonocardia sp. TaxID=60912 RepID=UPI002613D3B2|nr:hypothetical protein [Pseudonocardia sp.]
MSTPAVPHPRHVLVTGAAGGIGPAVAEAFAALGDVVTARTGATTTPGTRPRTC